MDSDLLNYFDLLLSLPLKGNVQSSMANRGYLQVPFSCVLLCENLVVSLIMTMLRCKIEDVVDISRLEVKHTSF